MVVQFDPAISNQILNLQEWHTQLFVYVFCVCYHNILLFDFKYRLRVASAPAVFEPKSLDQREIDPLLFIANIY